MPREYTYGPFQSRRLGLSLGVNVLSNYKLCTFNCVYCEIGLTSQEHYVSPEFRIKLPPSSKFKKELISILKYVPHINSITFGYNGEPTINENLLDFLEIASQVREDSNWIKKRPIFTLFTNSSTLHFKDIRERVKEFELVLAKLDGATKEDFRRTNRPHSKSPDIEIIIESLIKLRQKMPKGHKLAIQTLIYNSYREDFIPNNNYLNLNKLAQALKKIRPDFIQIYSIARIPAEYFVYAIDEERKKEIVNELKLKINDEDIKINYY
ncbi:MAG: hypothetical protein ACFFB0_10795 [Promethearchaeota archaeon]